MVNVSLNTWGDNYAVTFSNQALEMKTGARALRSIMETIMLDVMYDLPTIEEPVKVVINAGVVKGKSKAKVTPIDTGKKRDAA